MMSSIGHLFGCDSAKEEWRLKDYALLSRRQPLKWKVHPPVHLNVQLDRARRNARRLPLPHLVVRKPPSRPYQQCSPPNSRKFRLRLDGRWCDRLIAKTHLLIRHEICSS